MPTDQETTWLDEDQQRVWRSWLNAVSHIDHHLDASLRPFGLDLGEYEILVNLSEAENHAMRMSELADAVRQSRSRLTHTVARMERHGLLRRTPCPKDRRGVVASLTDEGMRLLVMAAPVHVRSVRECFVDAVDPDDFAALGRASEAINQLAH